MATKIACVHCGFIFEDEDMEVCPVCGTELGQEWDPSVLKSFVITELSGQQAEVIAKLVHKSASEVSKELTADGCFGLDDLTPIQVEAYTTTLNSAGIKFSVETSEQQAVRIQKMLEARAAKDAARAADSSAAAETAAKARAEAEAKAKQAAAIEAEKLASAKQADAEKAAQLAAAKNADAATEQARIAAEKEIKKAEAKAKAQSEAARLAEEERLKREALDAAKAKAQKEAQEAAENAPVKCVKCGHEFQRTLKYCPKCGRANQLLDPDRFICSKCKKEYTESKVRCEACGGGVIPPRSKAVYIFLAIVLGYFGTHNFYAHRKGCAIAQLVISILTSVFVIGPVAIWIWAIIEASKIRKDGFGRDFL